MEHPRYFGGIVPPQPIIDAVLTFRERWQYRSTVPHVTVKAPCNLTADQAWVPAVEQACQGVAPIEVSLPGVGHFNRRVVFLRVASRALEDLHRRVMKALAFPPALVARCHEGADFNPHLTLYIGRSRAKAAQTMQVLDDAALAFPEPLAFTAREVLVFKKESPQAGYQAMCRYPLQEARTPG